MITVATAVVQPGTPIAAELGVSYPSLKDWKRRDWGDATPERAEIGRAHV